MTDNADKMRKGEVRGETQIISLEYKKEANSLVLLQVNCRSIYSKALEFWNSVDTYNPDIIIDTESWLREEIANIEIFKAYFTTFTREECPWWGCVRNNITRKELWVDVDVRC
jgi:hypothetical protein